MAEKHLTDIELLEFLLKDLPDYEKEYIFNKYHYCPVKVD